jgi:3-hydroxyisobutyrate dehydrogenase-like beta-hydroxyacid dehydrogenase
MKLGMIGLGSMGRPIAHNLHRSGESLSVCAASPSTFAEFEAKGIPASVDPKITAAADLVLICVPDGGVVKEILFGAGGLAGALRPGALVVDLSTTLYQDALELGRRLGDLDIGFLDCPVSGMEKRAIEGTLTIMCGGDGALFEKARPYLERIGSKVLHMGKSGNGQLMKMTNQLVYDTNIAALAEVMPMAVKMGLDPVQAAEVINTGTGRSHASEYFLPQILEGVFDVAYTLGGAYKDLVSAAKISADHNIPMPVVSAMTATYQTAIRQGHGGKDKGAMVLVYEDLLDVKVRKPGF